jgi:cytochrome c-type biogenesis protein
MNQPDLIAAFAAGLVSFISPCVLPLLPAYLSLLSGLTVKELSGHEKKAKLLRASLMFSAGFTMAFTVLGVIFSGGMSFIGEGTSRLFGKIAGIVVIVLGLNIMFDFIRILNNDARLIQKFTGRGRGQVNAFLMGLAFAAGWSPCIGPILASILLMAARNANVGAAALLLVTYSAGFAIPFIASALFLEQLSPLLGFLKRHGNAVRIISGILLVAFGIMMLLGSVSRISAIAAQTGGALLGFEASSPLPSHIIGAAFWLLFAWLSGRRIVRRHRALKAVPGAGEATPRAQKSPATAHVSSAVFLVLAILELAGVISLLRLTGGWLTFGGL